MNDEPKLIHWIFVIVLFVAIIKFSYVVLTYDLCEYPNEITKENEMTYYKIRNLEGLFSTGGLHPSWNKKGKVWQLPGLRSHITMLNRRRYIYDAVITYEECDIVRYELVEIEAINLKFQMALENMKK